MPLYSDGSSEPCAILRADHIFADYQQKGFFRIGVLPALILEQVDIEVHDSGRLLAILTNAASSFVLKPGARRAVEGRGFVLSFASEPGVCLRAKAVRLDVGPAWQLSDGTLERPGIGPVDFRRATLAITGARAGELAFDTAAGPVRLPLLVRAKSRDQSK